MAIAPDLKLLQYLIPCLLIPLFFACNDPVGKVDEKIEHAKPVTERVKYSSVQELIRSFLTETPQSVTISSSGNLSTYPVLEMGYTKRDFKPFWFKADSLSSNAEDFISIISRSAEYGLFPSDYHYLDLVNLQQKIKADTVKRLHHNRARFDVLLTDAFFCMLQDMKQGRLLADSEKLKSFPAKNEAFFIDNLSRYINKEPFDTIVKSIEPSMKGYQDLKLQIKAFVNGMDTTVYTYLKFPFERNSEEDSIQFIKNLSIRLKESGIGNGKLPEDSIQLSNWLIKYQTQHGLVADGKFGPTLIKRMNASDRERFLRIAITMDRYKQMPEEMPNQYILVNLPAYKLEVWNSDTVILKSKIICGKPATATPFITSSISDMVIFPTWTVPTSIIKKEILPGLKKNVGYLARKGLNLYTHTGEKVDPGSVNWDKYSKGIPFKVQQGSGIDNALGVIKFNFDNPFDVYLHDTNQRYLFKKSMRALSHGCVRVQEWEKLAFFLARNDSMNLAVNDTIRYTADSISSWVAQKQRQRIQVKNKMPLFIRYFSCEGIDGKLIVHDDIYSEDKKLREKYFMDIKVPKY